MINDTFVDDDSVHGNHVLMCNSAFEQTRNNKLIDGNNVVLAIECHVWHFQVWRLRGVGGDADGVCKSEQITSSIM